MSELFVVATPIGNLGDITIRALETLKSCDVILCEDTRITNRLLIKYDIKNKKLVLYNDNCDEKTRHNILAMLQNGDKISLVSDAGTPLISDPGHKLIEHLRLNNIKITPIPGASSLVTALSVCGIAIDSFSFVGFLPTSKIQRQNYLKNLAKNHSFSYFESPNRIMDSLNDILEIFGDTKIAIARELTKIHEEIVTDNVSKVIEFFAKNPQKIRGEFVVIVQKNLAQEISDEELVRKIKTALKNGQKTKELSAELAEIYSINRKKIYQMALDLAN